jgi:hypothetical protein
MISGFIGVTLFCIYSLWIAPWIFRYNKHSNSIKYIGNQVYGVFNYIRKIYTYIIDCIWHAFWSFICCYASKWACISELLASNVVFVSDPPIPFVLLYTWTLCLKYYLAYVRHNKIWHSWVSTYMYAPVTNVTACSFYMGHSKIIVIGYVTNKKYWFAMKLRE